MTESRASEQRYLTQERRVKLAKLLVRCEPGMLKSCWTFRGANDAKEAEMLFVPSEKVPVIRSLPIKCSWCRAVNWFEQQSAEFYECCFASLPGTLWKQTSQEKMLSLAGGQGMHCKRYVHVGRKSILSSLQLAGKTFSKLQPKLASLGFFWLIFFVNFTVNLSAFSSSVYSEFLILSFPLGSG